MIKDFIYCQYFQIKVKRLSGNNRNRIYNKNKNAVFPKLVRLNKLFASKLKGNSNIFRHPILTGYTLNNKNTLYIRKLTK